MKSQTKRPGPTAKHAIIAIVILFALAAGAILLIWVLLQRDAGQYQKQVSEAKSLNNCLQSAWDTLDGKWTDDMSVDSAHQLTMTYYNNQIDCHTQYDTTANRDTNIQRLNEKKEDEQTTYKTKAEADTQNNSGMTCISNAVGSSAYTRCY
ncbi:MAG TPA: hypothetical protein VFH06_03045 [Candidatus Saccharimonadales bacterium]|nr:hypothetical protein [Candidatus Saccharimonadales bacterium]